MSAGAEIGRRRPDISPATQEWRAAEFFAGIGLAGLGMEKAGINVVWSNDIAGQKESMFRLRFGEPDGHTYLVQDLGHVPCELLPTDVDVAWASFPCTDLSIAGGRAGLHRGSSSSTFWHFIKSLRMLSPRRPPVIALENVPAFASSNGGRDIASAIKALNGLGYSVDVLNIDARHFVPQSRPRLFLIGALEPGESSEVDEREVRPTWLDHVYSDRTLRTHRRKLPALPAPMSDGLGNYLESIATEDDIWWSAPRVSAYVGSLSALQLARFESVRDGDGLTHRTAYRRMRGGVPRWEMRGDGISGCLRTASGGSSKQAVLELGGGTARIRWMLPVEYAALMGVPDFPLDGVRSHHAYSGFGDAVCAPAVEWLSNSYLIPLLEESVGGRAIAIESA